jgi:hypothetical protein
MKNTLKATIVASIIASTLIISCTKENINPSQTSVNFDENEIENSLKFVTVNERILKITDKKPIVIVQWDEWGRKKKNCDGWGLCEADWFPKEESIVIPPPNGGATILELDKISNKYYIDILLAEKVPTHIPIHALKLKIDEDIELLNIQDFTSVPLTIYKGNYKVNNSLGKFGGYRIYLN